MKNGKHIEGDVQRWYKNGELHREDGPAVIYRNGGETWLKDGKLHRVDGPAIICSNGHKSWYFEGQLHRKDGPAVIYSDGRKVYYLNDILLSKEQWWNCLSREGKVKALFNGECL